MRREEIKPIVSPVREEIFQAADEMFFFETTIEEKHHQGEKRYDIDFPGVSGGNHRNEIPREHITCTGHEGRYPPKFNCRAAPVHEEAAM